MTIRYHPAKKIPGLIDVSSKNNGCCHRNFLLFEWIFFLYDAQLFLIFLFGVNMDNFDFFDKSDDDFLLNLDFDKSNTDSVGIYSPPLPNL